jgi:alcohol dehydrogenase class IV
MFWNAVSRDKQSLTSALEKDDIEVVGVKKGMRPHTPWSQIIEIANEARMGKADCVVTLGAGSLTDGAKIVLLVSLLLSVRLFSPTYVY